MLPVMKRVGALVVCVLTYVLTSLAACGRIDLPKWADAGTDAAPDPAAGANPRAQD
jgi:hypothetical protein